MNPFLLPELLIGLAGIILYALIMRFIHLKWGKKGFYAFIILTLIIAIVLSLGKNNLATQAEHSTYFVVLFNPEYSGFDFRGVPVWYADFKHNGLYKRDYRIYISRNNLNSLDFNFKSVTLAHEYCHYLQHVQNRTSSEKECYSYQENPLNWIG